jgi:hypothetical protein
MADSKQGLGRCAGSGASGLPASSPLVMPSFRIYVAATMRSPSISRHETVFESPR